MRQPWNEFNSKMPWRMELGCYALNKLTLWRIGFWSLMGLLLSDKGSNRGSSDYSRQ